MEKIALVGDSLTWGQDPETGKRYSEEFRWASIVEKNIAEKQVIAISMPGMAVGIEPWKGSGDWCTTKNIFVEKVLKSFEDELDDVFLFFGANNYGAEINSPKTPKEIRNLYQELVDSIRENLPYIKRVHILLIPSMQNIDNGKFSLSQMNDEFLKMTNVTGFVDLRKIEIISKDNVHFSVENNKQVAEKVLEYIHINHITK